MVVVRKVVGLRMSGLKLMEETVIRSNLSQSATRAIRNGKVYRPGHQEYQAQGIDPQTSQSRRLQSLSHP